MCDDACRAGASAVASYNLKSPQESQVLCITMPPTCVAADVQGCKTHSTYNNIILQHLQKQQPLCAIFKAPDCHQAHPDRHASLLFKAIICLISWPIPPAFQRPRAVKEGLAKHLVHLCVPVHEVVELE